MHLHRFNNLRPRRRGLAAGFAVAVCLPFLTLGAAQAVHDAGNIELEGNAVQEAFDDWDNVCQEVDVLNAPDDVDCGTSVGTSGATAVDWVAEPNLNATIFTGGGSKDPQDVSKWAWKDGAGGLPDKDNLLHAFAARYSQPPSADCPAGTATTCDILYFGSDRYDNSGDAQQGFWFFQNAIGLGTNPVGGGQGFTGVHRAGDLLVISDFSNGGTKSTIKVYEWDPTCLKAGGSCGDANLRTLAESTNANCDTAADQDPFCGIVNPDNGTAAPWEYTDKSGNDTYLQGELYEGGVNLSLLGLSDRCFASVASETRSSTSTTATLKDFVLGGFGECGSTTSTQESTGGTASIGTGSVSVSDSATVVVTGISSWAGTVQFSLRGTNPVVAAVNIGSPVAISNSDNSVDSISTTVTAAGDYCWSAAFTSTTEGVPDSADDGTNECFTVTPVTPSLPTTAGPDVVLGNAVTDTAALSGTSRQPGSPVINGPLGAVAGGTITFALYKNDCTTLATGTAGTLSFPVTGDGSYGPASFTPDAVGTYHWKATYTPAAGDPNNVGSTYNGDCSDSNETVVVNTVPTSLTSAQSYIPNDSVTVAAQNGSNPPGTVTFQLWTGTTCSGTLLGTFTDNVTAGDNTAATNNTTISTTAANVSWNVKLDATSPYDSIPYNCFETMAVSINNGGTINSP